MVLGNVCRIEDAVYESTDGTLEQIAEIFPNTPVIDTETDDYLNFLEEMSEQEVDDCLSELYAEEESVKNSALEKFNGRFDYARVIVGVTKVIANGKERTIISKHKVKLKDEEIIGVATVDSSGNDMFLTEDEVSEINYGVGEGPPTSLALNYDPLKLVIGKSKVLMKDKWYIVTGIYCELLEKYNKSYQRIDIVDENGIYHAKIDQSHVKDVKY
jgi:hypothetical protein